ncbi:HNH endonuclease [Phytomonospora endophytica]|uniref:HNH nuclease domain-containing protein n=1 Tax=Phytomonospora endophytica TaxID=714109 RepID=A0A841FTH9_9ACTN|nr:HNH endonuclease [Phytomonospora endophytica]MBB6039336.1 hypothetical protein [Phytomonospora endophytica]GIG69721.1 hypothetical protein Pen01_60160 [Phytomonospora endophytica]
MVWVKKQAEAARNMKFRVLATSPQKFLALFGAWSALLGEASLAYSNGFLTSAMVREFSTPPLLDMLVSTKHGKAPLLHQRGDRCRCMEVHRNRWPFGFDYLLHDYLDFQPDAVEAAVKNRQAAERDDRGLRRQLRERDGGMCRYCARETNPKDTRGATGQQFDHVDPHTAAGASNMVTACRECNQRKGQRTPGEAGMRLLTLAEIGARRPRADHGAEVADHGDASYPASYGTGRYGEDEEPADAFASVGPPEISRPADRPNPYHRGPNRLDPEHFAGLPEVDEDGGLPAAA